jgi:arylsulfatase A-like enzyme
MTHQYLTGQWLSRMGGARVTPDTWPDTWPAQLRKSGYFGGHIGKVHVNGQDESGYDFWAGRAGYAWLPNGKGEKIHSLQ